jgi:hypothetical protein
VFVYQEMLDEVRNEQNFLLRVITGDTIWVYCYDPESKQQWKKPILSMKKARQVRSNIKSMLIFFDCEGTVHQEFVPPRQACTTQKAATAIFRQGKQLRAAGVDSGGGALY